jgi:proline dehydrogenase
MGFLWLFARRFVSGRTIEEALPRVKEMVGRGLHVTMDILGENVTNKEEPERFLQGYIDTMRTMKAEGIGGGISVKPTMMGMDIDQDLCHGHIEKIVAEAKSLGMFVRIDMEGTDYTQRSLDLIERLHKNHDNVGIVIQAYLHRSEEDVRRLNELGIKVRLCKGAYKEPKSLAIKKMKLIRENYKKLSEMLLTEGVHPAIATHDKKLIEWTKRFCAEKGIDKDKFEFQMLYGMRPKTQRDLVAEGYKLRMYVPYGTHWFPYFYRRLRERKENIWFVLKNFFAR